MGRLLFATDPLPLSRSCRSGENVTVQTFREIFPVYRERLFSKGIKPDPGDDPELLIDRNNLHELVAQEKKAERKHKKINFFKKRLPKSRFMCYSKHIAE